MRVGLAHLLVVWMAAAPLAASAAAHDGPAFTDVPDASDALARRELQLTLAECVAMAIRNNRGLESRRLGRVIDRIALQEAEEEFRPIVTIMPRLGTAMESNRATDGRDYSSTGAIDSRIGMRFPTGGTIGLGVENRMRDWGDEYSSAVGLTLDQPLLRGARPSVAKAALERSRRRERLSVLSMKSQVIGLVTSTVKSYRWLIQAAREVEISRRALQRAGELVSINQSLIQTGRMAEQEIVQTEANIAQRELGLVQARDGYSNANFALLDILALDSQHRIVAADEIHGGEAVHPDFEQSLAFAFENRPDYRAALLHVENAESDLLVARDNRLWDIGFSSWLEFFGERSALGDTFEGFDDGDYRLGLELRIPLAYERRLSKRLLLRREVALRQVELQLAEQEQRIEVEVRNAVRLVGTQFRRMQLAQQARELSEQKLELERIKLRSGRTTNFQLLRFEDDLIGAENSEVGATIAYLNALTDLDRALGATLHTYGIDFDALASVEERR
ncbi:MAG: TolC family protein [Gammaproteobacteria bacterium]|nr:TolC family protein [Gammaproteobacteria bacterium]